MRPIIENNNLKPDFQFGLFRIKQEDEYLDMKEIRAGVPQVSVRDPILYFPELQETEVVTYADDTAILAENNKIHQLENYKQSAME